MAKKPEEFFQPKESERRRDEVIRRMASTPPQPKASPRPKKEKTTDAGRAVRKARASREP